MRKDWASYGSFGPFAAFGLGLGGRARFFETGEVRLAILSLLAEGPKHGYQLMKEMAERSGGMYRASAGSVYPTLQQLEDEGLIASDRQDGRRVYHLTDTGRAELDNDPDSVRRIWERAERWEDWGQCIGPEAFAVVGSLSAIAKSALRASGRIGRKPGGPEKVRAILDRACHELDQL
jgi:DNA-binding PadR family transcriptional regulator